jgi:SAM-dependent methyltransferase
MEAELRILDLGCGMKKTPGSIGIDNYKDSEADFIHDLESFPYPFDDNSFDVIHCNHILEHLTDLVGVMNELCRICSSGAKIKVAVPYWASQRAFKDPTHVRFFTEHTFDYFDPGYGMNYYIGGGIKVLEVRYELSSNPLVRLFGRLLPISFFKLFNNTIANIYFELEVLK